MSLDPRHSVAGILAKTSRELTYEGTAFLVQGGVLVTCSHVLRGGLRDEAGHILVHFYNTPTAIPAEVLLDNSEHDLAILKPHEIPIGILTLPLAPSEAAKNHPFEAIGYPQKAGFPALYAQGSIYGLVHDLHGHAFLQLTSLENTYGYSGGPILDQTLNAVVGIVSNGIPRYQLPEDALRYASFAIATEALHFLYPELELITPQVQAAGWLRPTAPRPTRPMIGRQAEFKAVQSLLEPGKKAAITAAVQGTPGVGKTILAEQLASQLDPLFPGGVLFLRVGTEFRNPDLCNPVLRRWGTYAFGSIAPDEKFQPTPAEVRALLSNHGALLVVLDDLWDLSAIAPLQEALPPEACLLITTRSRKLAQDLHASIYPLDVLNSQDALALLRSRLPAAKESDTPLLMQLAEGLGCHALALDIAGGSLARLPISRWPSAVERMCKQVIEGTGFGQISLPEEDPDPRVESALFTSYQDLQPESQRRFRLLGVFAPDGPFSPQAAAGVWSCSLEEADDQLALFIERSLLTQHTEHLWRQHALLRAYCLALIRQTGEEGLAYHVHASVYTKLIRTSDDLQYHYRMLSEYPQLKHAFAWAVKNDLTLAQDLAANSMELQITSYLIRDGFVWAQMLLAASQKREDPAKIARAQGFLGNILIEIAGLSNEDRVTRIHEALVAFEEALKFYHPDTAPLDYAATQVNRGNVLRALSQLPKENRHTRLLQALDAYDQALIFYRVDTTPHRYAMTLYSRSLTLIDLAESPGEYRYMRLLEALDTHKESLSLCDPATHPLDHALVQNGYGHLLSELADTPGEDKRTCLLEALSAHNEALRYYLPEQTPSAYALTQTYRGLVLRDLSIVPGEDFRTCLLDALAAYDEALRYYHPEVSPLDYAGALTNRGLVFTDLARLPEEDERSHLAEAIKCYEEALQYQHPDSSPLDYAMTQGNIAIAYMLSSFLPEANQEVRVKQAMQCSLKALDIFDQFGHQSFSKGAAKLLAWISDHEGELFAKIWEELRPGTSPNRYLDLD